MPYEEHEKHYELNPHAACYETAYKDENGITYYVLEDGTVLRPGDVDSVSNGIWNGDNDIDYE